MKKIEAPILIAGAGPAGATLSLFLCKKKVPHLLIDKCTFPRDKICGDALSGKVVDVLNKLDPAIADALLTDSHCLGSYGVTFGSPNLNKVDVPFKKEIENLHRPPGFISKRIHFDNFLFSRINRNYATVLEGCEIKDIRHSGDGIQSRLMHKAEELTIQSKLVAGAEGDRSVVARQLGNFKKEKKHYCAGVRAYYKGVTGFHQKNFIELHFLKEFLPGYFWIFPLPNGEANVGAGMLSQEVSKRKINLKQVMLHAIQHHPVIAQRFQSAERISEIEGWGLPLGTKKRKLSGSNYLLTGDAASIIDPFTGEGIGNAMISSLHAADAIEEALRVNRFDAAQLKSYDNAVYKALWSELNLSASLQKLSKYEKLFNYVVNKANRNEAFRDMITCMFEDLNVREKLRNPKFYLKVLFN